MRKGRTNSCKPPSIKVCYFHQSWIKIWSTGPCFCEIAAQGVLVRQLEADILTISRGNSILVLPCFFKVGKYISECQPRWNFLWALANTFFVNITITLYYCKKRWYFKFNLRINDLHHEKAHKKLNIRHLRSPRFFKRFSSYWSFKLRKSAKIAQKPWALV